MVRLPFYPEDGASGFITGAGDGTASTNCSVIGATIPNAYGGATPDPQLSSFIIKTPQISWALLRIVGFEIEIHNAMTTAPSKAALDLTSVANVRTGLTLNASNAQAK